MSGARKITKSSKLITIFCFLIVVAFLPKFAAAQTVSLTPSQVTTGPNQPVTIDLTVNSVTDLYGVAFHLDYNPLIVDYLSVSDGGFLSQGSTPADVIASSTGNKIIFGAVRTGTFSGVNGSGIVARLNFRTKQLSGTSNQVFSRNFLQDSNLNNISSTWNVNTIRVEIPDTTPPTAATLTSTVILSNQINLSWSGATDNVGVTGYELYRNGNLIAQPTSTIYSDSGLNPSTVYGYKVIAFDAAGNRSADSNVITLTTLTPPDTTAPSVPSGLLASVISASQINLRWSASTDNVAVTGYRIYRNNNLITTINSTSYQNTGLAAATNYSYQVSAIDAAGNESVRSATANATTQTPPDTAAPSVPAGLRLVSVTANQINIAWDSSTDNIGVIGYKVYRNNVYIMTVTSPAYYNAGLPEGVTYSYQVSAVDTSGNESARTAPLQATTLTSVVIDTITPSVPTNLRLVSATVNQVNIAWNSSTDNVGVTGYRVYRNGSYMMTVTSPAYYNAGLPSGTNYSYQVSAVDAAGNESAKSLELTATTIMQVLTDRSAPTAPTGLRAYLSGPTTVNLVWYSSSDNASAGIAASGVAGYRVYRNNIWIANVNTNSYVDSALDKSTKYTYQIVSFDRAGNDSAKSNSVQISTSGSDTIKPQAPGWLRKYSSTSYSIEIAWNLSTDSPGYLAPATGVVGYKVYRNGANIATVSVLRYNDTNLIPQTSYKYQVSALDGAGNESALSGILTASTDLAPDMIAPAIPANLRVNYNLFYYPKDVRLYWYPSRDNRPGLVRYNIYRNGDLIASSTAVSYYQQLSEYGVYQYQVKAVDAAGNESVGSNIVSVNYAPDTTPPLAPTNLRINYNLFYYPKDVRLSWTGSRDERPGRITYNLYRNDQKIANLPAPTYFDKLTEYGVYSYTVKAVDAAGNESAASNMVTINYAPDTNAPSAPTNLRATYNLFYFPKDVRLSWTGSRDERPGRIIYNVYRNDVLMASTTGTSYFQKLSDYGSYQYQVKAVDLAGNESAGSNTVLINYVPDETAPPVPTNFKVFQPFFDKSLIRASWSGVRDERPGLMKYNVYRNNELISNTPWTSFAEKLLTKGSYQYQVAAVDAAGNESVKSNTVTISW